jgi:hypothetical protein
MIAGYRFAQRWPNERGNMDPACNVVRQHFFGMMRVVACVLVSTYFLAPRPGRSLTPAAMAGEVPDLRNLEAHNFLGGNIPNQQAAERDRTSDLGQEPPSNQ